MKALLLRVVSLSPCYTMTWWARAIKLKSCFPHPSPPTYPTPPLMNKHSCPCYTLTWWARAIKLKSCFHHPSPPYLPHPSWTNIPMLYTDLMSTSYQTEIMLPPPLPPLPIPPLPSWTNIHVIHWPDEHELSNWSHASPNPPPPYLPHPSPHEQTFVCYTLTWWARAIKLKSCFPHPSPHEQTIVSMLYTDLMSTSYQTEVMLPPTPSPPTYPTPPLMNKPSCPYYTLTWWARAIKLKSCFLRKFLTTSPPNVQETPRSLSPHPVMSWKREVKSAAYNPSPHRQD